MENQATFSKRLKDAREAKGLKQRELAEKIGVSYQTISAYEKVDANGRAKSPTLENAIAIANELQVSLDWLCGLVQPGDQFRTLGDVARTVVTISEKTPALIVDEVSSRLGLDFPGERTELYFVDDDFQAFLQEWNKIRELRIANTIDEKLYRLWLEDKFRSMDGKKIEQDS